MFDVIFKLLGRYKTPTEPTPANLRAAAVLAQTRSREVKETYDKPSRQVRRRRARGKQF